MTTTHLFYREYAPLGGAFRVWCRKEAVVSYGNQTARLENGETLDVEVELGDICPTCPDCAAIWTVGHMGASTNRIVPASGDVTVFTQAEIQLGDALQKWGFDKDEELEALKLKAIYRVETVESLASTCEVLLQVLDNLEALQQRRSSTYRPELLPTVARCALVSLFGNPALPILWVEAPATLTDRVVKFIRLSPDLTVDLRIACRGTTTR